MTTETTETEMRKNGTCLSPTQKTETDSEWTEVNGEKERGKRFKEKTTKDEEGYDNGRLI